MIKDFNFRSTPFREKVYSLFEGVEYALSLDEIESNLGKFDRITLYRTLKLFQDQGVIHIIKSGEIKKYAKCKETCTSEMHKHHHIHFTCDKCLQTECIESDSIDFDLVGYRIKEIDVNVTGFCKICIA